MSPPQPVPVIGLVGGIGSGKSSIARWLSNHRNVFVIDADSIGHDVLSQSDIRKQLERQFGQQVLDSDGRVNRAALARIVFGATEDHRRAREALERIVHPEIEQVLSETIHQVRASKSVKAIILDAAVLLEAGWDRVCDAVVFVESSVENRRQRVARSRGWTNEEWEHRETSQLDLNAKRTRADFVIHNDNSLEHAGQQLERIVNQWTSTNVDPTES